MTNILNVSEGLITVAKPAVTGSRNEPDNAAPLIGEYLNLVET